MGSIPVLVVVVALGTSFTGVARAEWAAAATAGGTGSTGVLELGLGSLEGPQAFSCAAVDGAVACEPSTQTVRIPITNTGSLPGSLGMGMALVDGPCEGLTVSIGDGDPEALCELIDTSTDLSLLLDPGSSTGVDVVFGAAPTAPSSAWEVSLEVEVSLGLWVVDGHADSSWVVTRNAPVIISGTWSEAEETTTTDEVVSNTQTTGSSDSEAAPVTETGSPTEGDEEGAASDPSTADDASSELTGAEPAEEPIDDVGETPPEDEPPPDDSSSPAGGPEEEGTGEEPSTVEPDPDGKAPDPDEEPVAEVAGVVSGVVWLDTDGDRLLVPGSDEAGVEGLAVVLLSEDGERIARVRTDQTGRYLFADLPPGSYVIEIHLPRGIAPSDPAEGGDLDTLAADIAEELGIDPSGIVVDDTAEVTVEPQRYRVRSAPLVLDGDLVNSADFALAEPIDVPAESPKDPDQVATRPERADPHAASEEEP